MAKSGTPKKEIEISNCNCKSYCSSDIYAKKENDEYTFTDIRTLVNFEEYKKIDPNSLDFTQKDINSIERSYRYKSAKFFDIDYNKNTRENYKFKVMEYLYLILWNEQNIDLPSAETLVSANSALIRCRGDIPKNPGNPKLYPSVNWNKLNDDFKEDEEIKQFAFRIATIGNFMPVPEDEQSLLKNLGERFDKELRLIRAYFNPTDSLDMKDIFSDGIIEWLNRFCQNSQSRNNLDWENFVNKNYLNGSFVDDKYSVIGFDGTLTQLSEMICKRSEVMIEKYKICVEKLGAKSELSL